MHSWKSGPGEVMTVENQTNKHNYTFVGHYLGLLLKYIVGHKKALPRKKIHQKLLFDHYYKISINMCFYSKQVSIEIY